MFPRERIILLYPKGNPMLQFLIKESKKYKDKEKLRRMIDFSTFLTLIKVLEYIVNKIRFGIKMISTYYFEYNIPKLTYNFIVFFEISQI